MTNAFPLPKSDCLVQALLEVGAVLGVAVRLALQLGGFPLHLDVTLSRPLAKVLSRRQAFLG